MTGPNARRTIKVSGQHAGQVKFTAYAGGVSSAPYTITIKELEAEITNLPAGNKMTVGQTHQLGKIVGPSDAKVVWHSRNGNVAKVENGKITALSPGTTVISIKVSKFLVSETDVFTLTVTENYNNPKICELVINNAIYYIKNLSGKYLDVYNGNTTDGTRLLQYNFNGSKNQRFRNNIFLVLNIK